jgi:riboflavin transporter
MLKFKDLFISSYRELKNVRSLTLTAMFCAISIVLGSLSIMIGENLKIGFSFLPNEFIFYLFGPVVGIIFGAVTDILAFIASPKGPYFFGFTASSMLSGLIYGVILYKRPLNVIRIIAANFVAMFIVGMFLNTYWLSMLYGNDFIVLFPGRALKELIMFPINTVLLFTVIKGVEASGILKLLHSKRAKLS